MKAKSKTLIVILSDENDISTNDVIDWIYHYDYEVLRINETSNVYLNYLKIDEKGEVNWSLKIRDQIISNNNVHNYWYRRGVLVLQYPVYPNSDSALDKAIRNYQRSEVSDVFRLINKTLDNLPNKIGSYNDNSLNKLDILLEAASVGIDVPDTLITSHKVFLEKFAEMHDDALISKAISNGMSFKGENVKLEGYTSRVEDISSNQTFFPTLFQSEVLKKWELRIFYL